MKRRSLLGPMVAGGLGAALLVAALLGWAMALNTIGTFTGLNAELAKTKAELAGTKADLSTTAEALVQARAAIEAIPSLARDRAELDKQVASLRAERAHLEARLGEGRAALAEAEHQRRLLSGGAPAYVTTGWAKLRAGPGTEAAEIAVVSAGASLRVLETVADGAWYKVGGIGFMHHTLLQPAAAPGQ